MQQMQRAADVAASPMRETSNYHHLGTSSNNDQQILADLDKIINNLELQQKNMATFGVPKLEESDEEDDDDFDDVEPKPTGRGTPSECGPLQTEPPRGQQDSVPPQTREGEATECTLDSGTRWTSLQEARDA